MAANIAKGDAAVAEAEAALNKTSLISSVFGFGSNKKFEDAADAYNRAGNFYKLGNDFIKAGAAYKHAAENFAKAGDNKSEVTNATVEAATCYKKGGDVVRAIKLFTKAIEMYNENSRIGMAARYQKEIAEIYEADHNYPLAIENYQAAARLFNLDNKKTTGNQCLEKAAQYLSDSGDSAQLLEAAGIFEEIAKECLSSRLGAYSAKNHLFRALIIFIALGDPIRVNAKADEYCGLDHSFATSRECEFALKLSKAVEEYNMEDYEGACATFDRITPLDPWKIKLLLQGKQPIIDATGGGGTGEDVDLS